MRIAHANWFRATAGSDVLGHSSPSMNNIPSIYYGYLVEAVAVEEVAVHAALLGEILEWLDCKGIFICKTKRNENLTES